MVLFKVITLCDTFTMLREQELHESLKLADGVIQKFRHPDGVPGADHTEHSQCSDDFEIEQEERSHSPPMSFTVLRFNYLLVTLAIMLADGLQGMVLKPFC
jgi:hypothetical protein